MPLSCSNKKKSSCEGFTSKVITANIFVIVLGTTFSHVFFFFRGGGVEA